MEEAASGMGAIPDREATAQRQERGTYQAVGVVAHVPQRDESQGDPAAVLRGDLVLPRHDGGHGPPAERRLESETPLERDRRR